MSGTYLIESGSAQMTSYSGQPCVQFQFTLSNPLLGATQLVSMADSILQYALVDIVEDSNSASITDEELIQSIGASIPEGSWSSDNILRFVSTQGTSYYSSNTGRVNVIYWNIKSQCPNIAGNKRAFIRTKLLIGKGTSYEEYANDGEYYYIATPNDLNEAIKTTNPSLYALFYANGTKLTDTEVPNRYIPYSNSPTIYATINDDGMSEDSLFYQYRVNGSDWSASDWSSITTQTEGETTFAVLSFNLGIANLGQDVTDGSYIIDVRVRDNYYNYNSGNSVGSSFLRFTINLQTTVPYGCFIKIFGQNGNQRYAGVRVNADGSFTKDRSVTVNFFGNSNLPLQCRIYSPNEDILIPEIDASNSSETTVDNNNLVFDTGYFDYKTTYVEDLDRDISTISCVLNGADFNISELKSIYCSFKDLAGNETEVNASIVLNNRIYLCENNNLQAQSSEYSHIVMKENNYGLFDVINESYEDDGSNYVRSWSDIYFPVTHGPKINNGTIDLDWALRASNGNQTQEEGLNYDPVQVSNGAIVYDSEGRCTTIFNTNKTYGTLISANSSNMQYWVLDNRGYGDIKLEFEHFHMDKTKTGPPYNNMAPEAGDCVVIYDASDERCAIPVQNADGTISYPQNQLNTAYMKILSIFTGSGRSVIDLFSGTSAGATNNNGAFNVEYPLIERVCIIVYTDFQRALSGFKLKASAKHGLQYRNWDIDEKNGELWVHEEPGGYSVDSGKKVRMIYNYYDTDVRFDLDRGFIILNENDIVSGSTITADYSYYKSFESLREDEKTRLYISTDDDYYDYLTPMCFVTSRYITLDKTGTVYNPWSGQSGVSSISGKLTDSYYSIDKDRGLVEIIPGPLSDVYKYCPFGKRFTIDYIHHTFYRLTNDGFGTIKFENNTIVADNTPVYPDVTFSDIMIVNEGDAILEAGRLKFKSRGETQTESSEVIVKVLDVNRPWDVQEGKKEVTFGRTRMYVNQYYTEDNFVYAPTTQQLKTMYASATSNDTGASLILNNQSPYLSPRDSIYGRIIWDLSNGGGSYPTDGITLGKKSWSCEITGKYFILED